MGLTAIGYCLVSTVSWTLFDVARKKISAEFDTWTLVFLLHLVQLPFFISWALLQQQLSIPGLDYLPHLLVLVVISLFSNFFFLRAVAIGDLSATIPLLALSPVFSAISGAALLGEQLTVVQMTGIGMVVVGCFLIHFEPKRQQIYSGTEKNRAELRKGSIYMVATAFLWATGTVIDKSAMQFVHPSVHASLELASIALILGAVLGVQKKLTGPWIPTATRSWFGIGTLAVCAAFGFQLMAIQLIPVALFEAGKRALGTLFSVLIGRFLLGESVSLTRWLCLPLLMGGVLVLMLS